MQLCTGIILAVLLADFITGVIHWWEDTYGDPDWKIIGRWVIEPNIIHHQDPLFVTRGSFWSRNYQTMIPAFAITLSSWWSEGPWWLTLATFIAGFGAEIHVWSHRPRRDNYWAVNLLHDMCLIQTPRYHSMHHHSPFSTHFCAITNILNPVLEITRFWTAVEHCLSCIGIKKNMERVSG
jgi:ubiquitin-conjugating enzyme E2 variant